VEAIFQSKNVSIQTIDEYIHLKEELSKYGLSTKDTSKRVNVIKTSNTKDLILKKLWQKP
jgi:hypothetical protein